MTSGNFKTTYKADMQIFQTTWIKVWMIFLFFALFTFPFVSSDYFLYNINRVGIAIIGALGLNILTGCTGIISLAHAALMGIGAYSSALLMNNMSMPFWIACPISAIIAMFIGLIVALPALRLKGFYVAIATMGFAFIIDFIILYWNSLTGGGAGMEVAKPTLGSFTFDSDQKFFFLIFSFVFLGVIFARNLFRTKIGRALVAIRDKDISAEVIGVSLVKYKIIAFLICSCYTGVSGSLYAHYIGYINPDHFSFMISIEYVAMIVVGGLGTIIGSIYGAAFMTLLPEGIRIITEPLGKTYPYINSIFGDLKAIVFGLIIIVTLLFEPDGLYGIWNKIKRYWKAWPFTY